MISVIIPTRNSERALVPCLAALVSGVASGVLRDVLLADAGSDDATAQVADAAGCTMIDGPHDMGAGLRNAAERARCPWLLFLRPSVVLEEGWHREVRLFVDAAERHGATGQRAAAFRFAIDAFGTRPRTLELAAAATRLLTGRVKPEQGLLLHRSLYDAAGRHPDGATAEHRLLARLGRRVTLLRSRAFERGEP